jgi:SAM-dependent methyltransferase
MSRWGPTVTRTDDDAKRFWVEAPLETLYQMMEPAWAWQGWLKVAAGVITEPGAVFEPGCGIGVLADVLPQGCSYYGCDINPTYVEEARRRREHEVGGASAEVRFEVRDLEDVLASGETFDWVVISSLFGMFPETTAYELIPRFWALARRGLSITTVDKRSLGHGRLPFEFSGHSPDRLLEVGQALPGVGRVELHRGREFPEFKQHHWRSGLALYAWHPAGG